MNVFERTLTSDNPFAEAVQTKEKKTAEKASGFGTLTTEQGYWRKRDFRESPEDYRNLQREVRKPSIKLRISSSP